jgi:hypothetical protein
MTAAKRDALERLIDAVGAAWYDDSVRCPGCAEKVYAYGAGDKCVFCLALERFPSIYERQPREASTEADLLEGLAGMAARQAPGAQARQALQAVPPTREGGPDDEEPF